MPFTAPEPSSDYTAVGVYIFAGGFTVGMAETFHIVGHLEEGPFGVSTFRANFPRVPVWSAHSRWPTERFEGVDVVYGNPPCAPWSPVGRSMRNGAENWRTDPNVDCARRLIQFGLDVQPRVWVMESVPQIQKSEFILDMAQIWLDAGYAFTLVREDAKFFGLPQQRRRCFMVAHRVEIPWQVFQEDLVSELVPAGDAFEQVGDPGTYPSISEQHRHLVPLVEPGLSMRAVWEKEHPEVAGADGRVDPVKGRPLLMIHRIDPTMPCGVVIGQNVYIHPWEDRLIGYREAAGLCGYPPDWEWINGSRGRGDDRIAQVAKAVTPPAARFLAKNLKLGLDAAIPADPVPRRATFWASSSRVRDAHLLAYTEAWSVVHACTAYPTASAEDPTEVLQEEGGVDTTDAGMLQYPEQELEEVVGG